MLSVRYGLMNFGVDYKFIISSTITLFSLNQQPVTVDNIGNEMILHLAVIFACLLKRLISIAFNRHGNILWKTIYVRCMINFAVLLYILQNHATINTSVNFNYSFVCKLIHEDDSYIVKV